MHWHKAYRLSNEFLVSILIYIVFHSNTSSENNYPKLKHNEKEPRNFSHDKRLISSFLLISMMKDCCYLLKKMIKDQGYGECGITQYPAGRMELIWLCTMEIPQ